MDLGSNVTQLIPKDIPTIYSYDCPRSKVDRRPDFAYYVKWGRVFVYRYHSQIRGYLACLPGSESVQLGPLLAEGEEEAKCLFQHAVMVFKNRVCRTRIMARDYWLARGLKELGFKIYSINNLMVRGTWRPGQFVEAFGIFPEGI